MCRCLAVFLGLFMSSVGVTARAQTQAEPPPSAPYPPQSAPSAEGWQPLPDSRPQAPEESSTRSPPTSSAQIPPGTWQPPPPAVGCTADRDCKGDRICQAGRCTSAGEAGNQSRELAAAPAKDARVGFYANALGLLQFGLSPTIEVGDHLAVNGRVLIFNTGVLPYVIAGDDTLHLSIGAGPGIRYYFGGSGSMRGFYLGTAALLGIWEEQYQQEELYKTKLLICAGELGYRWVFGSGFTLGFGGTFGAAIVIDHTAETVSGGRPVVDTAESRAIGFLHLDLGVLL